MVGRVRTVFFVAVLGLWALCGSVWAVEGSGPIAHWKFDKGEGSVAYDSAGDNDGTIYGATWTTGQINGALSFDDDGDYVLIPDSDSISVGNQDYTIAAWIYPKSITGLQGIATKVKDGADKEYAFSIWDGEIRLHVEKNSNNEYAETSTTLVTTDSWQHIAVTFNSSSTTPTFYYNGQVQTSSSNIDTLPDQFSDDLYIGMWGGIYNSMEFNGTIDDVRIYDRALSTEEIQQLYQEELSSYERAIINIDDAIAEKAEAMERIDAALDKEWAAYDALEELLESGDYGDLSKGDIVKAKQNIHSAIKHEDKLKKGLEKSIEKLEDALAALGLEPELDPNLAAYWKFDEGEGDTAYDSAGNNDGTIYGAVWTTGQIDGALSFDGVDDYVAVNFPDNILDNINGTWTAWFKVDNLSSHFTIITTGTGEATEIQRILIIEKNALAYANEIQLLNKGSFDNWRAYTDRQFNENEWYHIALIGGSDGIKFYINGQEETLTFVSGGAASTKWLYDIADTTLYVGWDDVSKNNYANGSIDDVRIYDRALSAEEIQQFYEEGLD